MILHRFLQRRALRERTLVGFVSAKQDACKLRLRNTAKFAAETLHPFCLALHASTRSLRFLLFMECSPCAGLPLFDL